MCMAIGEVWQRVVVLLRGPARWRRVSCPSLSSTRSAATVVVRAEV